MKKKLSVRAAVSLLLSALLFCMPVGAFMANSGNTVDAYAEESGASEEGSTEAETEENTYAKSKTQEKPISDAYAVIDNDLARDNLENDIPDADLQDLQ